MKRWGRWLGVLGVMIATMASATQNAVPSETTLQRIWQSGETIEMSLAWLKIVGGTAVIKTVPVGKDRLKITSLATSNAFFSKIFKVRDEIESLVERDTLSTISYSKKLQERSKYKEELTVVDPERNVALRKGKEVSITRPIYDPLSLIFLLRTFDLGAGKKMNFNVLADGKLYPVEAVVLGREIIRTDAAMFRTVLVEPKMSRGGIFRDENSRLLIWFTDDEKHIPIRIRSVIPAGNITATLRNYRAGTVPQAAR